MWRNGIRNGLKTRCSTPNEFFVHRGCANTHDTKPPLQTLITSTRRQRLLARAWNDLTLMIQRAAHADSGLVQNVRVNHRRGYILMPSNSCTVRMSYPFSNRCVANECRNVWQLAALFIPMGLKSNIRLSGVLVTHRDVSFLRCGPCPLRLYFAGSQCRTFDRACRPNHYQRARPKANVCPERREANHLSRFHFQIWSRR